MSMCRIKKSTKNACHILSLVNIWVFCIIFTFRTVFHFLALYLEKIALLLANQN